MTTEQDLVEDPIGNDVEEEIWEENVDGEGEDEDDEYEDVGNDGDSDHTILTTIINEDGEVEDSQSSENQDQLYTFERMVMMMEQDKKAQQQRAKEGHKRIVGRLKEHVIVQKVLATENAEEDRDSASLRSTALKKLQEDAQLIIANSPSRPRTPTNLRPASPAHASAHNFNSSGRPSSAGSSSSPSSPSLSSFSPSSPSPSSPSRATRGPKPVAHSLDSMPTTTKEQYLQMQRSIAHLPQPERYKREKIWLQTHANSSNRNTNTITKQKTPQSKSSSNGSSIDITPW